MPQKVPTTHNSQIQHYKRALQANDRQFSSQGSRCYTIINAHITFPSSTRNHLLSLYFLFHHHAPSFNEFPRCPSRIFRSNGFKTQPLEHTTFNLQQLQQQQQRERCQPLLFPSHTHSHSFWLLPLSPITRSSLGTRGLRFMLGLMR